MVVVCTKINKDPVQDDEYNINDSLQVRLIEEIVH